jgi:competence protein ComEC
MDAIPTGMLWASLPEDHALLEAPIVRVPCAAGRSWRQDGVSFEFLHPAAQVQSHMQSTGTRPERINNRSCVLRIANPAGSVLIAGDIERAAERELLERSSAALAADVLIVPHHGSRTSSSPEFVRAVAPRFAVFTVGYRNRFGHPREDVLSRYREAGSRILRTDETGALQLRFAAGGGVQIVAQREAARRYWHAG